MKNAVVKNAVLKNTVAGTVLGGGLLFTAGLGLASAQPAESPEGLVTVAVGTTAILEGVDAETAATAAGAICGTPASDVTALVERATAEGTEQTVCEGLPGGALAIRTGVPAAAEAPADVQIPGAGESMETAPAEAAPVG
ncbi:hypothetical protein [Mycolicibacterium baixiangningiae]|uniref:hypothetical protein n=1 Tax=Mycolicibacterium baixiangningiae TaxID=2761578 RepID=UPI0018D09497|nr:hypothetical protein [Mycolicibacterium baixiangningiae]